MLKQTVSPDQINQAVNSRYSQSPKNVGDSKTDNQKSGIREVGVRNESISNADVNYSSVLVSSVAKNFSSMEKKVPVK